MPSFILDKVLEDGPRSPWKARPDRLLARLVEATAKSAGEFGSVGLS